MATNPRLPVLGTPSPTVLTIRGGASATLSTQTPTLLAGETAKLSIRFTGDAPWSFTYRDSVTVLGAEQTFTTSTNPYLLELKPRQTTAYHLTSLRNSCTTSNGLLSRVVILVSQLLAVEPLAGQVSLFPMPANASFTVRITAPMPTPATLELIDAMGKTQVRWQTQQAETQVLLDTQPADAYFLRVQLNGQTITRQLRKL